MGMKKKVEEAPDYDASVGVIANIPPVPSVLTTRLGVPSLPKTSVAPKSDPNGVSPVAPTVMRDPAVETPNNGTKGLGSVLASKSASGEAMTKADWQNKDKGISIDAIHKSSLESPTLANLAIGKSDSEVLDLIKRFLKFNLELNQMAKRGDL